MSTRINLAHPDYPYNLLNAITDNTNLQLSMAISEDQLAGLSYALSTLDQQEHAVLVQLYQHQSSAAQAGEMLCLSDSQIRQLAARALEKLRTAMRWNYIQYGVAGYSQKKAAEEYDRGYRAGYLDGTQDTATGIQGSGSPDDCLNLPLNELPLSVRIYHCLSIAGHRRVRDLAALRPRQIHSIYGLGTKGCREVALALQELGIHNTAWDSYLK